MQHAKDEVSDSLGLVMLASACLSGKLWKWFSLHPATYWITPCLHLGEEKQAELSLLVVTLNTFCGWAHLMSWVIKVES